MIVQVPKRVQRSPPLMISYPITSELAPYTSSSPLASPPSTPPRGHKHSLSKPMTWLSRSSSSTSNHPIAHAAPKPIRISEPKFENSLEIFGIKRGGPLGSGATVVRTPQEALSSSGQPFGLISEEKEQVKTEVLSQDMAGDEGRHPSFLPPSPPLPPLPLGDSSILDDGTCNNAVNLPLREHIPPSCPTRPLPPAPNAARRPSLKPRLRSSSSGSSNPVPALPANIAPTPLQPPFDAILLSSAPDSAIDPSKIVITLETCTMTHRTSLRSLTSRPSYLSSYVTSLLSPASETASIYSNASDVSLAQQNIKFNSVFYDHLASSGCLRQSSTNIHVFLDRPSAPYAHILTYLRSLPGTPEQPEALPHAVQLGSSSRSRLECLLELRDEASYLGLDELHKLCCYEINHRHSTTHSTLTRGASGSSAASIHSLHTVVEQCQPYQEVRCSRVSSDTTRSGRFAAIDFGLDSPSVPRHSGLRERSRFEKDTGDGMKSPPLGWI
ncbi:hypothetical protein PAXRUDRAFT_826853 [Paxillus rubicundulus Ve08.2h10]|uniref:BTB domain-containing protein n=1 Tax=Paxillus rubicundulus Ve08.2h10 TaxID=930991 RepID=A0A0D0DZ05_9AGAM|nr:hypothetical protein PAXRUDRAFT_826853 [Paxillus rubicundulus Ve08.2h10]